MQHHLVTKQCSTTWGNKQAIKQWLHIFLKQIHRLHSPCPTLSIPLKKTKLETSRRDLSYSHHLHFLLLFFCCLTLLVYPVTQPFILFFFLALSLQHWITLILKTNKPKTFSSPNNMYPIYLFLDSPSWPSSMKVFYDKCKMTWTIQPTPYQLPCRIQPKLFILGIPLAFPSSDSLDTFFFIYHLVQSLFDIYDSFIPEALCTRDTTHIWLS